jgi:hypothetical protein
LHRKNRAFEEAKQKEQNFENFIDTKTRYLNRETFNMMSGSFNELTKSKDEDEKSFKT